MPVSTLIAPLKLIKTLVDVSSRYPSFERESQQPVMGKLAVSMTRLMERVGLEQDWNTMVS